MRSHDISLETAPRRRFLNALGTAGLSALGGSLLSGCGGVNLTGDGTKQALVSSDADILNAAKIAEATAVTCYTQITQNTPFFMRLPSDDQNYFRAALQEDMAHYALFKSATGDQPSPFTSFFFPKMMFTDPKTTLDTLVTLEEAFVAAYLIAVRDFSASNLRVLAARILGVQSTHRLLARVVAANIAAQDGGPIATLKGLAGLEESVDPPNNNLYERTYHLNSIQDAVTALKPFFDATTAEAKGFDTSRSFPFQPFTPTAPSPLGDING